jgi:hypothetical protein
MTDIERECRILIADAALSYWSCLLNGKEYLWWQKCVADLIMYTGDTHDENPSASCIAAGSS